MANQTFCPAISSKISNIKAAIEVHLNGAKELGEDKDKRLESYAVFSSSLKKQAVSIYSLLNYSVLSGEYVVNEKLPKDLDQYVKDASDLVEWFQEKKDENEAKILFDVVKSIKNDISRYKSYIHIFWKSVENPYKNLVNVSDSLDDADNSVFMNIKDYSDVFRINLNVMRLDSTFALSNRECYILTLLKQHLQILNKKIQEPFVDAILEKIQLLICKYRYKEDHKRQEASYYVNDGVEEHVDINKLPDNDLGVKIGKICTREVEVYKYNIKQYLEQIESPKTTFDFFIRCHYYKNVVPSHTLLQKVETEFIKYASKIETKFDKANTKVCENYFRNCWLSFLLKQNDTTIETVKNELDKIRTLQIETQYDDYFPYYKVAEWELSQLNKGLQNYEKVENLEQLLSDAKQNLYKAQRCLRSTKHNDGCFIPFRPFYNDCIAHIRIEDNLLDGNTLPLFCLSSFVLPLDYDKEDRIVDELFTEYSKLCASVEGRKSVNKVYSKLQDCNKDLQSNMNTLRETSKTKIETLKSQVKNDLKDNQRSVIEILSVFAAIVIFASGSIQILTKSSDVLMAGQYMLLFSAGLGVMGVVLSCIFRRSENWNKRDIFCIIFCGIIIILSAIALFGGNSDKVSREDVKNLIKQETEKVSSSKDPINVEATISIKEEKTVAPSVRDPKKK